MRAGNSTSAYHKISLLFPNSFGHLYTLKFHSFSFNEDTLKHLDREILESQVTVKHITSVYSSLERVSEKSQGVQLGDTIEYQL